MADRPNSVQSSADTAAGRALILACVCLLFNAATPAAADSLKAAQKAGYLIGAPLPVLLHADRALGRRLLGDRIEWPMYDDPKLVILPASRIYSGRLTGMWMATFAGPNAELRLRIIGDIIKAHREGMPGLPTATGAKLARRLTLPDDDRAVRLAAAEALIVMDIATSAKALWERNQVDGVPMILSTDPALARWNYKPARAGWLARLKPGSGVSRQVRLSAIDALGAVREPKAAEDLRAIVFDTTNDIALRLAAAEALGAVVSSGLVPQAEALLGAKSATVLDRLMAVSLLASHSDEPARRLLLKLTEDEEPPVVQIVARSLLKIDPMLLQAELARLSRHADAGVRTLAVEGMAAPATSEVVRLLAQMLNDRQVTIRVAARLHLLKYEQDAELKQHVRDAAMQVLNRPAADGWWRGQVEAAELLGRVGHKQAVPRLFELLDYTQFGEPRIQLVAAVNLRRLAGPDDMPALLEHCKQLAKLFAGGPAPTPVQTPNMPAVESTDENRTMADMAPAPRPRAAPGVNLPVAAAVMQQAFQAFGELDYRPAEPLLRKLVPRKANGSAFAMHPGMRAAALWALGKFYKDNLDESLADMCVARLNDMAPFDAEAPDVRGMAAVVLARIGAVDRVRVLKRWGELTADYGDAGALGCRWAIAQLTSSPFLKFRVRFTVSTGWVLEPAEIVPIIY
jgi:hypothetical protein